MARVTNLRLDDQLCFALYAATNTVTRAYRPLLAQIGLTYPQYLIMLVLWQDGGRRVHEIASRLALPAHAVSPLLDRLQDAGLLTRRRDVADRRVVHVQLTEAGAELQGAASRVQRRVACQTRLSPAALAELRDELHRLVDEMTLQAMAVETDAAPRRAPRRPQTSEVGPAGNSETVSIIDEGAAS